MSAGASPNRPMLSIVPDTGRDLAKRFAPPPAWKAALQREDSRGPLPPKRTFPPVPEGGAAILAVPAKSKESAPC